MRTSQLQDLWDDAQNPYPMHAGQDHRVYTRVQLKSPHLIIVHRAESTAKRSRRHSALARRRPSSTSAGTRTTERQGTRRQGGWATSSSTSMIACGRRRTRRLGRAVATSRDRRAQAACHDPDISRRSSTVPHLDQRLGDDPPVARRRRSSSTTCSVRRDPDGAGPGAEGPPTLRTTSATSRPYRRKSRGIISQSAHRS